MTTDGQFGETVKWSMRSWRGIAKV